MKNKTNFVRTLAAVAGSAAVFVAATTGFTHAGGKTDNKQIVTGTTPPCALVTSVAGGTISASAKTNADGTVSYFASPVSIRGQLDNCSTSLQAYYIEFTEQAAGVASAIPESAMPQCVLSYWSVGDFLMKSGESKGWSMNMDVAPEGMATLDGCVGDHTVAVRVIDRTSGATMQETTATYTVVAK